MSEWMNKEPAVLSWTTPPAAQGQTVEYSYGYDEDGDKWERKHDRSYPDGHASKTVYRPA